MWKNLGNYLNNVENHEKFWNDKSIDNVENC